MSCFIVCINVRLAHSADYGYTAPGMVANPARGQLNKGLIFSLCPFAPGLARRVWSSRPLSARSFLYTPAESSIWYLLTGFLPLSATASTHIPSTAIGSIPSLSGYAIAYRWCSLPRVRRHRASKPQISFGYGWCLFRYHHGQIFMRLSFPTPTIGM